MSTIKEYRTFYEEKIAPMIHEAFPEYENRIAVGLSGEGSECFGYDDWISQDHDFGKSICLWLTDEDYDKIGQLLAGFYRRLVESADGSRLSFRRGVQKIRDFYTNLLGFDVDSKSPEISLAQWFYTEDWKFATATNGEVFRDDLGEFRAIRTLLMNYYPERIWRMKLIEALHGFSGSAQANYPRCMARGDKVAASICVRKGIEHAMEIAFLLKRTYAPYYKWTFRALKDIWDGADSGNLISLLEELTFAGWQGAVWDGYAYDPRRVNPDDKISELVERIAVILAREMVQMGLTDHIEPFLEVYCAELNR